MIATVTIEIVKGGGAGECLRAAASLSKFSVYTHICVKLY
jgi:hypothetical protein